MKIEATRIQWIKFAVVLILWLIFLVWLKSWLGLVVVPFIFDAYITKKIGAEALGLYTLLGSVYSFALTLALSGINLTVTRLVSDAIGEGNSAKMRVSMMDTN